MVIPLLANQDLTPMFPGMHVLENYKQSRHLFRTGEYVEGYATERHKRGSGVSKIV